MRPRMVVSSANLRMTLELCVASIDLLTVYITFTLHLHLADAFIQSDLQGCIHIFTFTLMAHCTSGAIRGSVSCSKTLRQGIECWGAWVCVCESVCVCVKMCF